MFWEGIEETAERVCDKHGVRQIERSVDGIVWGVMTVIDGGKKGEPGGVYGWEVKPESNLVTMLHV